MENAIEFICLGSSSSGNCFIFKKNDELVMVECGFTYSEIQRRMISYGLSLSQVKSVIITHKHKDHSLALKNLVEMGLECYVPSEMKEDYKQESRVYSIEDKSIFQLTSWLKVYCFSTIHDVESYGFAFLDTENKQSILFINDTKLFEFPFKNTSFDIIFCECNHIRKQLEVMLQQALDNGKQGEVFKFTRQAKYHLSLASCKRLLHSINLSKTSAIFLMHLSKQVCNDVIVKEEIKTRFNKPVYICGRDGGLN